MATQQNDDLIIIQKKRSTDVTDEDLKRIHKIQKTTMRIDLIDMDEEDLTYIKGIKKILDEFDHTMPNSDQIENVKSVCEWYDQTLFKEAFCHRLKKLKASMRGFEKCVTLIIKEIKDISNAMKEIEDAHKLCIRHDIEHVLSISESKLVEELKALKMKMSVQKNT